MDNVWTPLGKDFAYVAASCETRAADKMTQVGLQAESDQLDYNAADDMQPGWLEGFIRLGSAQANDGTSESNRDLEELNKKERIKQNMEIMDSLVKLCDTRAFLVIINEIKTNPPTELKSIEIEMDSQSKEFLRVVVVAQIRVEDRLIENLYGSDFAV